MYAVQSLVGSYFKRFISFKKAYDHANEMTLREGQPHQVVEMKLLYMSTLSKLQKKAHEDYKEAARSA